ncbi:Hypothetical_protein [Hexamita inflata]|uniref:Hypothetical_protein n=1 Tax=Hexamita inflata TaxID=28002 RepID=A0ABP1GFV7_9EUKA
MNIIKDNNSTDITLVDLSYKGCFKMCYLFGGTFIVIIAILESLFMASKMKKQYSTQNLGATTRILICVTTPLLQAVIFTVWCPLHALVYWLLATKSELLKYLDKYYEQGKMSVHLYYISIIIWSIGIPITKLLIGINDTSH